MCIDVRKIQFLIFFPHSQILIVGKSQNVQNLKNERMILRVGKKNRFTIVDNETIEHRYISYRALGLLTYLVSKPDDWIVMISELSGNGEDSREGRDAVYTSIKELIEAGFIDKVITRDSRTKRITGTEYVVREAITKNVENLENFPDTAFPDTVKPTLLNTEDILNTEDTKLAHSKENNNDFFKSDNPDKNGGDIEISIALRDGSYYVVDSVLIDTLKKDFPSLSNSIVKILLSVERWNRNNPRKRKTRRGVVRHIYAWIERQAKEKKTTSIYKGTKSSDLDFFSR